MAATRDILASYRRPGTVVARIIGEGEQEPRALIFLMVGCLMVFVAQTPRLARQAFETGEDLRMLLGATLMAWLFIAPLILYVVAGVTHLVLKLGRRSSTPYGSRIALFWALLASCPLMLLWGLTAGFVGPGVEMTVIGVLWVSCFAWFWGAGLIASTKQDAP